MLKKKFNIALLVVTFAILTLSFTAFAAEQEFKVTTDVTDGYTYSDGLLRFFKGGEYTIEMAEGVTQTTHKMLLDFDGIYEDTRKITLIFSELNMIADSGNNIDMSLKNSQKGDIDLNLVIKGNNTIKNTYISGNNDFGSCMYECTSVNTTVTGNGKLTLDAVDDAAEWANGTFTLASENVTLDLKSNCLSGYDGVYISAGELKIVSSEPCIITVGEFYMTGGTLDATSTGNQYCIYVNERQDNEHQLLKGVGCEILGGDVTLTTTGTQSSYAPILIWPHLGKLEKSIVINTTGTVTLENKGNGMGGILLLGKAKNFTMSGGTLIIKGYSRGLWGNKDDYVNSRKFNFNGGEIEIIGKDIYAIANGFDLNWGENYKHKNYAGSSASDRVVKSDNEVRNGGKNSKYLLITPAYDITYDLDGGSLPPNANPTRYTRVDNITLTNPTQNLKKFVGWTGSNGNVPQKPVIIPVGSTGNLEYKANWDNLPYTVYFFSNYEPGTYNTQTFKYDESERLDANSFTRAGYNFTGWNTEGQPTTEKPGIHYDDQTELNISISNRLTEDRLSLWAQWNLIPAQPPTIITQPQNLDLIVGYSEGKISIQAEAAENHTITGYQWYSTSTGNVRDGVPIVNATTADYMIPTGKDVGKEYYYCIVTATRNDNGQTAAVTSNVATVTINPKQAQTIAAENVNVPDTGDRDYLWRWMGLATLCLVCIILLRRIRGK